MNAPLLTTKLYIPPVRQELVSRPRLIERLNAGLSRKLTLLSAPAGFGKTTLVAEWLDGVGRPFAWLSLDERDNDPFRFLTYLIAALKGVNENIGREVESVLGTPQVPPVELLVTALVNDIASLAKPFVLVLDDYHVISTDWIHEVIEYLITYLPAQIHLLLLSRHDPPLALSRLRVRDQLTEIRADDLRFTRQEAASFLNRSMDLNLSEENVTALGSRTEGWVAGLQLAALALRSPQSIHTQKDVTAFIEDFGGTHRYVIDYLADEVLRKQPEEIRAFLRQTSVLDRLSAPVCNALIGRDDSAKLLRQLEVGNLFLIPLDGRREWYRYHPLFSGFLRTELGDERGAALHLKAARWFAGQDLWEEAVGHALASGEMDEAARMVALAAGDAVRNASFMTLLGWLDALPDHLVQADCELATYKGFMLVLFNRYTEATVYAESAEQTLLPETPQSSRGRLLSLQAHMALFSGASDSSARLSKEGLDYLGDEDFFFRDLTFNILGQALDMQGDLVSAADVYRDSVRAGRRTGNQLRTLVTLTNLLFAWNELGRRQEAVSMCQQVLRDSAVLSGALSPLNDVLYLGWSLLSYEASELDLAMQQVARARALCERANIIDGIWWGQYILARVHLARGESDAALRLIHDAQSFPTSGKPHEDWFPALEAEIKLQRGDLAAATRWAQAAKFTPTDVPHHWNERPYFTYARQLLAQGRLEEAGVLLANLERSAQVGERRRKLITVNLLQALLHRAQGDESGALGHLGTALRLAAPENYIQAILNQGSAIAELLPKARHIAPAFVDGLVGAFQAQGRSSSFSSVEVTEHSGARAAASLVPLPVPDLEEIVESISERELQVLGLVANGLSNREVAEALFVTVGTVKKHLNNLFGKLAVKSRTQAVARARELNLLP
jgi:LuxR family maltose regulon positive regulatory protein